MGNSHLKYVPIGWKKGENLLVTTQFINGYKTWLITQDRIFSSSNNKTMDTEHVAYICIHHEEAHNEFIQWWYGYHVE